MEFTGALFFCYSSSLVLDLSYSQIRIPTRNFAPLSAYESGGKLQDFHWLLFSLEMLMSVAAPRRKARRFFSVLYKFKKRLAKILCQRRLYKNHVVSVGVDNNDTLG